MRSLVKLARLAAAALAFAAAGAQAGGPLDVCNDAAHTPLKYSPPTVDLNYDMGTLGARTKAQADAIVTNAVALWTNVGTSNVTIGRGADLPVDVTTANYTTYIGNNTYSDGLNPVVYDTDGSITDLLLGTGARNSVLGFAGSAYYLAPTCRMAEGRAVINGYLGVTDATMTIVMAHEIGHLIGMDHTQLDSTQGLSSAPGASNYPLMYPIAYRDFVSLHEDDAAAVSALYPDATLNSVYGQISGTFTLADGLTPVVGANLWATETTTGKLYSIVSDYLTQGTGYFKLLLPAGTYNLRAEAIDRQFTGGSSVGPYSADLSQPSFQAPLYSGTTPMATVTLGNSTPTAFTISAGCAATLTFRINGTGTVGGNCGNAPASMVSPTPGTSLTGSSQVFTWNNSGASLYQVTVGNSVGATDIGIFPVGGIAATSITATGLPTDGRTLYVRLYSQISGAWYSRDYTYTAYLPPPAAMTSPAPGTQLTGTSATFSWSAVAGATSYQLWVGTTAGAHDLAFTPNPATSATSASVTGLPMDGRTLYVRLYTNFNGAGYFRDYTYTAYLPPTATMVSPAAGSTLTGSTQTFTWTNAGAVSYQVWVGTAPGTYDIGYAPNPATTATSATIGGIPTDGRTIYVRLWTNVSGTWLARDYTYRAFAPAVPAAAVMSTPAPGSTLTGSTQTFTWTNTGATAYQVWVGTAPGTYDIGYAPNPATTATSATISGIPADGRTIYVRLWSNVSGAWQARDYTYTAAGAGVAATPASMSSPTAGSMLAGSTQTFTWTNTGAAAYQVWVGTAPGTYDIGYAPNPATTATSATISGIPTDGRAIYVRLWSNVSGSWQARDYTYTAAGGTPTAAAMVSPAPGGTLSGSTQAFTWSSTGATAYQVWVGTAPGTYDIGYAPNPATTATSATLGGIPTDGRTVYVRLWSNLSGSWQSRDYTYRSGP